MIRLSNHKDIEGITNLWHEAFGDSKEDIEIFINNRYVPENTLICEKSGKVVSVLFLLEGVAYINQKEYPSYYLYAACTLKEHRGEGIMSKMLAEAQKTALSRNRRFIFLLPAEPSLYGYYGKFGYIPLKKKLISVSSFATENTVSDEKTNNMYSLREAAFANCNRFIWDNDAINYAINMHIHYGGNLISSRNGYVLYTNSDSECLVKEYSFTGANAFENCVFPTDKPVRILLPFDYQTDAPYETVNGGMVLSVNNDYPLNIDSVYLGLTLD